MPLLSFLLSDFPCFFLESAEILKKTKITKSFSNQYYNLFQILVIEITMITNEKDKFV